MGLFGGMPPNKNYSGAKITEKTARYLVLKGQNFFNDPLKTGFLDESRGLSFENKKIQNLTFHAQFCYNLSLGIVKAKVTENISHIKSRKKMPSQA